MCRAIEARHFISFLHSDNSHMSFDAISLLGTIIFIRWLGISLEAWRVLVMQRYEVYLDLLNNLQFFIILSLFSFVLFFVAGCAEDDGGGTKRKKGAIADDATLFWGELYIIYKCACIAVVVFQGVAQAATLITTNGDGAMIEVYARVDSLESGIGWVALLIATYNVVAHLQWYDLLVMKHVFDYNDRSATLFVGLLVRILVLLSLTEFAHTNAYAKLLAAVGALEH